MNKTLTATQVAALAAPAMAGGPVIVEEPEVLAERPASNLLLPVIAGVVIGLLITNDDDPAPCLSC